MDPLFIRVAEPLLQVGLQLTQPRINLLAQGKAREFIEPGLMHAFDDPLGLRTLPLRARMINVFYGYIQFILMAVRTPPVLRAPIGSEATQRDLLLLEERHPLILKQLGSCQRRFAIVEFGTRPLALSINEGLLVDPAYAL